MARSSVMQCGLTVRPVIHGCVRSAAAVDRATGSIFRHAARKAFMSGGNWLGTLNIGGGLLQIVEYRTSGAILE